MGSISSQMVASMSETSDGHCGHQVAKYTSNTGEPNCSEVYRFHRRLHRERNPGRLSDKHAGVSVAGQHLQTLNALIWVVGRNANPSKSPVPDHLTRSLATSRGDIQGVDMHLDVRQIP